MQRFNYWNILDKQTIIPILIRIVHLQPKTTWSEDVSQHEKGRERKLSLH